MAVDYAATEVFDLRVLVTVTSSVTMAVDDGATEVNSRTVEVETGTEGEGVLVLMRVLRVLEEVTMVEVAEAVDVETGTEEVLVLEELTRLEDTEAVDVAVLTLFCEALLDTSPEQRPQALSLAAQLPRMGSQ